jgi:hypothetical protein
VTPIGAVAVAMVLGLLLGNGSGLPGAYLVAGIILLCFAAGYAAMSEHVTNAGAFYAYITKGLGRPAGVTAAFVALAAYNAIFCAVLGAVGAETHLVMQNQLSINLPWEAWSAIALALIALMGRRQVNLNAAILGVALALEIAMVTVLDIGILTTKGLWAFSLHSFAPATIFAAGIDAGLVFAFNSFIGFEASDLRRGGQATKAVGPARNVYRNHPDRRVLRAHLLVPGLRRRWRFGAKDDRGHPRRSGQLPVRDERPIRRRIHKPPDSVPARHEPVRRAARDAQRDRSVLLRAEPRRSAPERALPYTPKAQVTIRREGAQIAICALIVALYAIANENPLTTLATSVGGVGTLGIVILQAGAAFAVVGFFARLSDGHWLKTLVAPLAGGVGLVIGVILIVHNYGNLVPGQTGIIKALPWLLLIAAAAGLAYAFRLRSAKPRIYARMGEPPEWEAPEWEAPALEAVSDPLLPTAS